MDELLPEGTILGETAREISRILGPEMERITIDRVVVGLFFTGVKLAAPSGTCGAAGASATPLRMIREAVCCPSSAMAMPTPGKLRGRRAWDLIREIRAPSAIRRAVGIATINALAELCWQRRPHFGVDLSQGVDAYDAVRIRPGENVVVVGAFAPFLRALKRVGQPFTVLEIDPRTFKPDELAHFRPAADAPSVVPAADVLLITGTTLLTDTLEALLARCRPTARVVVVGPTVSLLPDAYLRRGVDVLGGIHVTDADAFLDVLSEGGSGYHIFGRSAEKVVLLRKQAKPVLAAA